MIFLLINPSAGKGRSANVGKLVGQALTDRGLVFQTLLSTHPGHCQQLAKLAADSGCTLLIAVGGDGTMGEIAQVLCGTSVVLGIIPAGTGNDYIKTLGMTLDWAQALEIALSGRHLAVDIMQVNDHLCLNIASVGIDAYTAYYANRCKHLRGQLAYIKGLAQAFFMAPLPSFTFCIDGGDPQHQDATLAVFANGQYYGGGFRPIPSANNADGIMDVLMIDKLSRPRMIPLMVDYAKGKHEAWDICHFYRCQHISLHAEKGPLLLNVDGETCQSQTFDIRLLPASLLVAVPPRSDSP